MAPVFKPTRVLEKREMRSGSCAAEKTEPDPLLGSQNTPWARDGDTCVTITSQGGKRSATGPTGFLAGLKSRARRWAVQILVLNLILSILLLIFITVLLTAQPAGTCELCPAGAACPGAACPDGWLGYLGKCYYFSEVEANWTDSQNNCSAHGASLAVIDTPQELTFLMCYKGRADYWIGLWREPTQPWKWTNGTEFNNWFKIVGREKCAFLNRNDIASSGCSREGRWLCSRAGQKPGSLAM
ncbi:uncharacterized protein LOC142024938 isoform X1 [Carettochelys insculpta]|uniref:uncharacterized protein LOC142024938 isoform X1 n=1 Tax=Carettochelys insculpta TaxID=44489 RepID=UPI003EBE4E6F